jgi:hypothetical protein
MFTKNFRVPCARIYVVIGGNGQARSRRALCLALDGHGHPSPLLDIGWQQCWREGLVSVTNVLGAAREELELRRAHVRHA